MPYFEQTIAADLKAGKTVLIAAHGNSLRALVKYLDGMSDDEITEFLTRAAELQREHVARLRGM